MPRRCAGWKNYLRKQYGADFEEREFTVAIDGPPVSARYYFPPNFRQVVQAKKADFVIGFTLDDAEHYLSDLPVYQVTRMGALLSVVVDHREFLAEQRIAHQPLAGTTRRATNLPLTERPGIAGADRAFSSPRSRRSPGAGEPAWNVTNTKSSTAPKTGCGGSPRCTRMC